MSKKPAQSSRRDFIKLVGMGLAASALSHSPDTASAAEQPLQKQPHARRAARKIAGIGYNVVLIVTDQERHFRDYPQSAELFSREKLQRQGVSFENHYNCSNMCTASRSVMYTGRHIQHTGMFDNTNLPWQPDMSTEIPTIGDMMRELGYYTAYKGKVHLSEALTPSANKDNKLMTDAMEPYGFSDFNPLGDEYGRRLRLRPLCFARVRSRKYSPTLAAGNARIAGPARLCACQKPCPAPGMPPLPRTVRVPGGMPQESLSAGAGRPSQELSLRGIQTFFCAQRGQHAANGRPGPVGKNGR